MMLWARGMRARWSFVVAGAAVGAGAYALLRRRRTAPALSLEQSGWSELQIDEAVEGSFPASDPPPWTLGDPTDGGQAA